MQVPHWIALPVAAAVLVAAPTPVVAEQEDAIGVIDAAIAGFQTMLSNPSTRIPAEVVSSSEAILIIPELAPDGFLVRNRRGRGLIVLRQGDGTWSNPAFINLTNADLELKFEDEASDIMVLFRDPLVVSNVLRNTFEFNAGTPGVAGPVGDRTIDAATANSDALAYARYQDRFQGVAIAGGTLRFDNARNEDFYELDDIQPRTVLNNRVLPLPSAPTTALRRLYSALQLAPASPLIAAVNIPAVPATVTTLSPLNPTFSPIAVRIDLGAAKRLARQAAEKQNGGFVNYNAEATMYDAISEAPSVRHADGSWTFTFLGGHPGWQAYGGRATLESVVTVTPTGEVEVKYNGPVR